MAASTTQYTSRPTTIDDKCPHCDLSKGATQWYMRAKIDPTYPHNRIAAVASDKLLYDHFTVLIDGVNAVDMEEFIRGCVMVRPADYVLRFYLGRNEVTAETVGKLMSPFFHDLVIELTRTSPAGRGEQAAPAPVTAKEAMAAVFKLHDLFTTTAHVYSRKDDHDLRDICKSGSDTWKHDLCIEAVNHEAISSAQAKLLELLLDHPAELRTWLSS